MNKELWEKLDRIRDELNDALDFDGEETTIREFPAHAAYIMQLADVQKMIRGGLDKVFKVGDEIWTHCEKSDRLLCWIVIDKGPMEGQPALTLWCVGGIEDRPFDEKSEKYPYGHACWRDSSLRQWMNIDLLGEMSEADAAAIAPVKKITLGTRDEKGEEIETTDKLWLLSMCELGFAPNDYWSEAEGSAFEYFGDVDHRAIGEWYWSRSANRGYAYSAWIVYSSGSAGSNYATFAYRPAPACVIR